MTAGVAPRLSAERLRAALGTGSPRASAPAVSRRFASLEALVPGREIETEFGHCFVAEWTFPLEHRHGHERLSSVLALDDRGATCIARVAGYRAPERPVFLDT